MKISRINPQNSQVTALRTISEVRVVGEGDFKPLSFNRHKTVLVFPILKVTLVMFKEPWRLGELIKEKGSL